MDYKWAVLTVTTVGTVMAGINVRIVTIGLPTIARQLSAGPEEVIWITQAFALASVAGLLLIGRIGDIYGRVRVYNIGFVIFGMGSALSSISLNPYQLIACRVLQGMGAGILQGNAAAIVTDASPKNELGMMLGINQTGQRLGNVLGLTLSGVILSVMDWRGLFYLNIPIAIFGTVWAYRRLREMSVTDQKSRKIDWLGFALFSSGLTSIMLAITFMSYGTGSLMEGYGFLVGGVVLIALFVKAESWVSSPLLDLSLFRNRTFSGANVAQLLNTLAWFGALVAMAFYLQIALGYPPLQASLAILPLDVTYLVSSLIFGRLSDRYDVRLLATSGLILDSIALAILSTFGLETGYLEVSLVLALVGIGTGMFTPSNVKTIMESVPPERRGIGAAFMRTMLQSGNTASYGLIILLITFGIPYNSLSVLLQSSQTQSSALAVARVQFINGFSIAMIFLALANTVAILSSAVRSRPRLGSEPGLASAGGAMNPSTAR